MRVLCLTIGPDSEPSSRFRVGQWVTPLARQGIELEVRPRASRRYLDLGYGVRAVPPPVHAAWAALQFTRVTLRRIRDLVAARRFDLLLLQKETFPFGLERLLPLLGVRVVYDFDDAIYLRTRRSGGANAADGMAGALRATADAVLRRDRALPALLARCDTVIAGNPNLAAYARRHCERVRVIPTVVDTDRYRVRPVRTDGTPVIGWIGAPPNVRYLEPLRPVLADLARRFALRFTALGPSRLDWPDVPHECVPWRHYESVEDEVDDVLRFDIGIMPLPDEPFAAGKCALKAIQYMAAGIPVVASPVGVNAEVVQDGVCGYLARTPEEWTDRIGRLLVDPELRARLGRAGRARAEACYSIRSALPALVETLRDAATAPAPGKRRSSASTTSAHASSIDSVPVLSERS